MNASEDWSVKPQAGANPSSTISGAEQRDFELIVSSARHSGWLHESATAEARIIDSEVMVSVTTGTYVQTRAYERNGTWLYRFLRELANGDWRRPSA